MKKGEKGEVCGVCCGGTCTKCCVWSGIVFGILLGAWALWFPQIDWRLFFGGLLVIGGVLKLAKPCCPHCG